MLLRLLWPGRWLGLAGLGIGAYMIGRRLDRHRVTGMFADFGLPFLRLTDKLSLLSDLAFYVPLPISTPVCSGAISRWRY